jgi:uncharacterized protein HemX
LEEEEEDVAEKAKPGLLARLTGPFRRAPAEPAAEKEEETHGEAEAAAEAAEEEDEARPASSKKTLLLALLLLAVVGVGIGSAVLTFKRLQAGKEAEYQKQQAVLAEQQEQLKKQQAEMAALKAQNEKLVQEAETAKTAQPPAELPANADSVKTRPTPEAGDVDCAVVGKENAAETIKRCIEAYNRATGRTR